MRCLPESDRLRLRLLTDADAPFIRDLVTQPSWLENISDPGVRTEADALAYLQNHLNPHHAEHGFGFWLVERREDGAALGICGLVTRPGLDVPDLGYALLPQFWGHGYAREAARATVLWARRELGLDRLVAIVTPGSAPSIRVLEAVGMHHVGAADLPGEDEAVDLFEAEWTDEAA